MSNPKTRLVLGRNTVNLLERHQRRRLTSLQSITCGPQEEYLKDRSQQGWPTSASTWSRCPARQPRIAPTMWSSSAVPEEHCQSGRLRSNTERKRGSRPSGVSHRSGDDVLGGKQGDLLRRVSDTTVRVEETIAGWALFHERPVHFQVRAFFAQPPQLGPFRIRHLGLLSRVATLERSYPAWPH